MLSSCGNVITALRYPFCVSASLWAEVGGRGRGAGAGGQNIQSRGAEGAFPRLATSVSVRGLHEFQLWHFPDGLLELHQPYSFIIYCWLLGVSFNVWVWETCRPLREYCAFSGGTPFVLLGELME